MRDNICAFSGEHADELNISDPSIPTIPPAPDREHSVRNSVIRTSIPHSSRKADRPPLGATPHNVGAIPDLSMAEITLGASSLMIGSTIDPAWIAQPVLQAIRNPTLRHATNLSTQLYLGPPQYNRAQHDPIMVPDQPPLNPSYHFYNPQPREAPPMVATYPSAYHLTPDYPH
ncbi:hypothetical protein AMTR_s00091p00133700 [Amborella trichopoda]|uniref:Uncharacterized protein n=1 Tax=Amborella trichopoda TaxID=13333 RepID=W1NY99_AMBTC|nr:hypothetical protein AMTR_s00091p00133700 [Amborella trichopoda]